MMNNKDYHYFVLKQNSNPQYSFTAYFNNATGETWQIFKGQKDKGVDIPHRWKFDRSHRTIRVHKNDKSLIPLKRIRYEDGKEIEEIHYLTALEFLRNYPECKGSPNGTYRNGVQVGVKFSEVREEEDAATAIDAKVTKNKAVTAALNLEGEELREMGILYGLRNMSDNVLKHRLTDLADADPSTFLGRLESPERSVKALLEKSVAVGAVERKGSLYIFGGEVLGHDEAAAISKLMGDKDIRRAVELNSTPKQ